MTSGEDTKTIIAILCTADGSCAHCAKRLISQFIDKYPNQADTAKKVYERYFEIDWDEE